MKDQDSDRRFPLPRSQLVTKVKSCHVVTEQGLVCLRCGKLNLTAGAYSEVVYLQGAKPREWAAHALKTQTPWLSG